MTLDVSADGTRLELTVADDGRGFDPGIRPDGLGLLGMRERLAPLGGTLSLQTGADEGTVLRVTLPMADGPG